MFVRGAGGEPEGSESSLSVCVSAFCSWTMGVWVPWDVTDGAGCRGWSPMAFIRPMSLSGLRLARAALKQPIRRSVSAPRRRRCGRYGNSTSDAYPDLSEPRVRPVPLLLTENKGSPLASAGLSPSLR